MSTLPRTVCLDIIREVVNCRPGKVGQVVEKFKAIAMVMREMGHHPFRLLTDVSGDPFWTVMAETSAEWIDA